MIQLHAINLAQKCWSGRRKKLLIDCLKYKNLSFQVSSISLKAFPRYKVLGLGIWLIASYLITWNASAHLWNYWHEPGLCVVQNNITLRHMQTENESMRPEIAIRQTRRTLRPHCLHRPHLPPSLGFSGSLFLSQVSDNLFSCPGPPPKHQMLQRLDITFIRWAFPKIRGFKHNCNYSLRLDDGTNNSVARYNGMEKIDEPQW